LIVNHLSRELGARRLTMQEVARRAGLSYTTVHDLYHDRAKRLDLETLDKLCAALGVGVGDLFEYQPDGSCGE